MYGDIKVGLHIEYTLHINAYHVQVKNKAGEVVYKRGMEGYKEPPDPKWLDESHFKITQAISALETAVLEAVHGRKEGK